MSATLFGRDWLGRLRGGHRAPVPAAANPPLTLPAVERVLALYTTGLTDGALTIASHAEAAEGGAFTDGRTIFLPERLDRYEGRASNLRLYKALIAHAAAQVLYGTLDGDGGLDPLGTAPEPALATALFDLVEGTRLSARLGTEFPGIGRDLAALAADAREERPPLARLRGRAQLHEALLRHLLATPAPPNDDAAPRPETGLPQRAAERYRELLAILPPTGEWVTLGRAESVGLALALARGLADLRPEPLPSLRPGPAQGRLLPPPPFGRSRIRLDRLRREVAITLAESRREPPEPPRLPKPPAPDAPARGPALVVEGQGPPPPLPNEERRRDDAGGRQVAISYADTSPQFRSRLVPLTAEEKRGAFLYPEWDVTLNAYRPEWCALRPRRLRAAGTEYVERVLRRHHAQVQALKRQFETLRPERQRLRRQDDGEDLDLDAVVASHVDRRLGLPPDERPYMHIREARRDIAVAFLIDLSGSTGGYIAGPRGGDRVIDVAKQSLVLLCEALATLDDRYAIYGFSGATRKGCEFYEVKDFAAGYDDEVKRRLGGLIPLAYTRLGPPIRHTTTLLGVVPARVRLLMLLSDGRPNDFDAYGGEYGIADTRKALLEARGRGIRTFCLTIDAEARDYMP
ncbi:MAG: hypothetical protein M3Q65_00745, partial [Chloroflexota bacterium]|nr:hypothetical protein [Chloroflexota bacterium]